MHLTDHLISSINWKLINVFHDSSAVPFCFLSLSNKSVILQASKQGGNMGGLENHQ